MDAAAFVKADFCRPDIIGGQPLHFFAVYDSHGGSHVSTLCKKMMHSFIADELRLVYTSKYNASMQPVMPAAAAVAPHRVGGSATGSPREELPEDGSGVSEHMRVWENRVSAIGSLFCGSTTVVAILTPMIMWSWPIVVILAASFAMLGGPESPDELERIKAACGLQVVNQNGVRGYGILNMSLSLGETFMKSIITSQPEISVTERDPEDECLILASDGIWDVMSDEMACEVACTSLRDGSRATVPRRWSNSGCPIKGDGDEVLFQSKSSLEAAILCRLALGRGSGDNISGNWRGC